MASEVDICNLALGKLGATAITSLAAPSTFEEEQCKLWYPVCRDAVLEEHTWSWASARYKLNPTGNDPVWGDDIQYQRPQGIVAVARLYANTNTRDLIPPEQWKVEGQHIYSSEAAAYAVCVTRVLDPQRFTGLFVSALAARLAAELCNPLTENTALSQQLWGEYAQKVREAAASDGLQARREIVKARRLIGARGRV